MLSQTIVIFAPFGTVEEGLNATLRLVIEPELENVTGEFFDGLNLSNAGPSGLNIRPLILVQVSNRYV
jgi:hypothetical protein